MTSLNRTSHSVISTLTDSESLDSSVLDSNRNLLLGSRRNLIPRGIVSLKYKEDGTFERLVSSSHHGDFAIGEEHWISPDGTHLIDSTGVVYTTSNLRYSRALGTTADDLDFSSDGTLITRSGKSLTRHSSSYLPVDRFELNLAPAEILVMQDRVYAFSVTATSLNGYEVVVAAISGFQAPVPLPPVDPVGKAFITERIETANDGTLLLFDRELGTVFQWNPQSRTYSTSIGLTSRPDFMSYSSVHNKIYFAYSSGLITQFSLSGVSSETSFAALPKTPSGLATAGPFLVASASYSSTSHYVFDAAGTQTSSADYRYRSAEYVWNPANQSMYFFWTKLPRVMSCMSRSVRRVLSEISWTCSVSSSSCILSH